MIYIVHHFRLFSTHISINVYIVITGIITVIVVIPIFVNDNAINVDYSTCFHLSICMTIKFMKT